MNGKTRYRVLLVDDDARLRDLLSRYLQEQGFAVKAVIDAPAMDRALHREHFDLMVLDLMLPGEDGLAICRRLRAAENHMPIIMLTAKGDDVDRIVGLEMGADDYLPKPFHTDELMARLRALARRERALNPDGLLRAGDVELDPHRLVLTRGARDCKLTPKESQLLELLIKRRGSVAPKERIIEKLWGYDTDADESRVEIHVSLLRKKLAQIGSAATVRTIRGAGYALEAGECGHV